MTHIRGDFVMEEKIMIIDVELDVTKITTVDGTKRNLVKYYEIKECSFRELVEVIYNRFKKEGYDRIVVDAYGVGVGLIDYLISLFENDGYCYDSKTGTITKRTSRQIAEIHKSEKILSKGDARDYRVSLRDLGLPK